MQSSAISPHQCQSQAVVCVSTPRMYLQSGYFLVYTVLKLKNLYYEKLASFTKSGAFLIRRTWRQLG